MSKQTEKWEAVRAQGRGRFILLRGVLGYGLPMLAFMTFLVNPPSPNGYLSRAVYILFSLALWAVGGALFGTAAWWMGERAYRKATTSPPQPPA